MFERLEKETEQFRELFKKIMKYHFDWVPEPPTQNARVKQVKAWIREIVPAPKSKRRDDD